MSSHAALLEDKQLMSWQATPNAAEDRSEPLWRQQVMLTLTEWVATKPTDTHFTGNRKLWMHLRASSSSGKHGAVTLQRRTEGETEGSEASGIAPDASSSWMKPHSTLGLYE